MIDKIYMNSIVDIPIERLTLNKWRLRRFTPKDGRHIEYYTHFYKNLIILYKPSSQRLTIKGRLVTISIHPDRITNLDELLEGITEPIVRQDHSAPRLIFTLGHSNQNLNDLIQSLNTYLSDLISIDINIRDFHVTQIEICFNVITDYVSEYITIFNKIFKKRKLANYTNFVLEKGRPIHSSFYVKGKVQYEKKKAEGFIVNFYNKKDQLMNLLKSKENSCELIPFFLSDAIRADKVLRMEVQCYYKALYYLFPNYPRDFNLFINIEECREIIKGRYKHLIGNVDLDFYSYNAAIVKINDSSLSIPQKKYLKDYLLKYTRNNTITDYKRNRYQGVLRGLGIHWFLIPTSMNIDYLESPIKILERQIAQTWEHIASYDTRMTATQIEVDLYNSIEVTEDSSID